jgi:hypothetical protein
MPSVTFKELSSMPAREIDEGRGHGRKAQLVVGMDFGQIVFRVVMPAYTFPMANSPDVKYEAVEATAYIDVEQGDVMIAAIKSAQKKIANAGRS